MNFAVNDYVEIITQDEWCGMRGLITHIESGYYVILCVKEPVYRYYVKIDEWANQKIVKVI